VDDYIKLTALQYSRLIGVPVAKVLSDFRRLGLEYSSDCIVIDIAEVMRRFHRSTEVACDETLTTENLPPNSNGDRLELSAGYCIDGTRTSFLVSRGVDGEFDNAARECVFRLVSSLREIIGLSALSQLKVLVSSAELIVETSLSSGELVTWSDHGVAESLRSLGKSLGFLTREKVEVHDGPVTWDWLVSVGFVELAPDGGNPGLALELTSRGDCTHDGVLCLRAYWFGAVFSFEIAKIGRDTGRTKERVSIPHSVMRTQCDVEFLIAALDRKPKK